MQECVIPLLRACGRTAAEAAGVNCPISAVLGGEAGLSNISKRAANSRGVISSARGGIYTHNKHPYVGNDISLLPEGYYSPSPPLAYQCNNVLPISSKLIVCGVSASYIPCRAWSPPDLARRQPTPRQRNKAHKDEGWVKDHSRSSLQVSEH